jgi:hypothetical protein
LSVLMPRYFFNVVNGDQAFLDADGEFHRSDTAAIAKAMVIASELAKESEVYRDYHIAVLDQNENEIARVPVKG